MIDFLSDTVTRPTEDMRNAMFTAAVGDDVYGEDPTVNRLEALAAERLGKEEGCFMPSGTMANLTSILAHCERGAEMLVGDETDIYHYEAGGPSVVGGVVFHPVRTRDDGTLAVADLEASVRDAHDFQCARTGLLCLENPHCRKGGRVLPLNYLEEVRAFADKHRIPIHMDGARIFNAAVALNEHPSVITRHADSVQFCLSKSLAAPIGSIVVGQSDFILKVRRLRKMLGGGMRQAGVIAAAGIVALEQMVERLAEDHARADKLARSIGELDGIDCDLAEVQTNMVFFRVIDERYSPNDFLERLVREGIRMSELGNGRIRAVVHYQISDADIQKTIDTIAGIMN